MSLCVTCGKTESHLAISGHEQFGVVCSEVCGRLLWNKIGMMGKRPREPTDQDELYQQLEQLLREARDASVVVEAEDNTATQQIVQSLRQWGCAFVNVPAERNKAIRKMTGTYVADTFELVPDAVKNDLQSGKFSSLLGLLNASGAAEQYQIWGKGIGMLNRAPIGPGDYGNATSRNLGLVHSKSPLAALNNVRLWSMLPPQLHPDTWYVPELRSAGRPRIFVPDDGIKIKQNQTYNPTGLHYDGQLGDATGIDANRVQVVYCDDVGPVRLCVVAASHTPAVRDLIQRISGIRANQPTFDTANAQLKKHPKLLNMLKHYGMALPRKGLLMFVANVWHFEGSVNPNDADNRPLRAVDEDTRFLTRQADVFRIYCGVVAVHDTPQRVKELVEMAYWREHGWTLEPFNNGNKRYELFVNHKVANSVKRRDMNAVERQAFAQLNQLSYLEKRYWVFSYIRPERLTMYGLSPEDGRGRGTDEDPIQIYE